MSIETRSANTSVMTFETALTLMKSGAKMTREGWNGPGQYVAMQWPDAHSANTLPYFYIHPTQGGRVPWVPSVTDLLMTDWKEVK